MLDFTQLKLEVDSKYSFVGIKKEKDNFYFYLPKGFENSIGDNILDTFDFKKKLFFLLYQVFKKFKKICSEKGYIKDSYYKDSSNDREGVFRNKDGLKISVNEKEQICYYSKLDMFSAVLDNYNELKIMALLSRLAKSEEIDYSKIHKYIDKGIFLNNGAIYIDSMMLPKRQVRYGEVEIVLMYCYLFTEIKEQLKEGIKPEIIALSERFKEKYIGNGYSLFSEDSWKDTLEILRDTLEVIDRHTPLKEPDYWDFYDAIELFLYGGLDDLEDGEIWGIDNFWTVWESMCLTYCLSISSHRYLLIYSDNSFVSNFTVEERGKDIEATGIFDINGTHLKPDLVTLAPDTNDYLLPLESSLILQRIGYDDWNDSYFYTCVNYYWEVPDIDSGVIYAKTALKNQEALGKKSTYSCLKQVNYKKLFIKDKIKEKTDFEPTLYSYWNLEDLDLWNFYRMFYFNHVFYIAFKKKIFSKDKFFDYFENLLGEVLGSSLMRGVKTRKGLSYFSRDEYFENFVKLFKINVVDFKYKSLSYYLDVDNINEIKIKDIRKQFVYEYLIQSYFKEHPLKNFKIKSEFWIPVYSNEKPILSKSEAFMNDYIELIEVNPIKIMEKYVQ